MQNIPLVVACIRKRNNFPPPKKITLKLKDISKKNSRLKTISLLINRILNIKGGEKEKFCYRIINESLKYIQNLVSHKKNDYYLYA